MPSEQQALLLSNPPLVFGPKVVSRKAFVDWALSEKLALPPTDPSIFEFRLLHIDSLLVAIERGARNGDAEHVIRAAKALAETDRECDAMLANRVKYRDVVAAREYLAGRGVSLWASHLRSAIPERLKASVLAEKRGRHANSGSAVGDLTGSALLVLSALKEAGYDPQALPPSSPGLMNPAKAAARDAVARNGVTADDFEKAWKLLQRSHRVRKLESRSAGAAASQDDERLN